MKKLFVTMVFVSSISNANAEHPLDTQWITGNAQMMKAALSLTRVLSQDTLVYHYVDRSSVKVAGLGALTPQGPINNRDALTQQIVLENMKSRMQRFWMYGPQYAVSGRDPKGNAMAPNGLYAAVNPVISKNYGGKDWVSYQLRMPKGTRVLDGRNRRAALPAILEKALIERGCTNPIPEVDPTFSTRSLIKSDTRHTACRKALAEILAATETPAVIYYFNTEVVPQCMNKSDMNTSPAFVIVSPKAININDIKILSKETPAFDDGLHPLRETLNAIFQHSNKEIMFDRSAIGDAQNASQFMRENFYNCPRR